MVAAKISTFKDLEIWKKSLNIAVDLYKITLDLPKEEIFGLTSQMRRAVISTSSNIAEGYSRASQKEFSQFLSSSLGSCAELRSPLDICMKLNYLTEDIYNKIDMSYT